MTIQELNKELGNIDIYLLDQILKGRYPDDYILLDAGCGEGRNLIYFLNNKFKVYGIDQNSSAIRMLQYVARTLNPAISKDNFILGSIDSLPFPDEHFHSVICNAVLHFAENEEHFFKMWAELFRVVKSNGTLFLRMASNIGAEEVILLDPNQKAYLPDGSFRFLLSRIHLKILESKYGFIYLEPVKTVNVQDQRFMTTLVLQKT
jgi:ubiquinone/menaquinone biosynthesis C-methylase UbiE